MEGTAVTRRKATAVGARLALRHGVSAGMAVLRSHRATLDIAMGADAATAAILAQIGKGLSILLAAAAPMRPLATPVMSSLETADLSSGEGSHLPRGAAVHQPTMPSLAALARRADRPASPPGHAGGSMREIVLPKVVQPARSVGDDRPASYTPPRLAKTGRDGENQPHRLPTTRDTSHETSGIQPTARNSRAPTTIVQSTDTWSPLSAAGVLSPSVASHAHSFAPTPYTVSLESEPKESSPDSGDTPIIAPSPVSAALIVKQDRRTDRRQESPVQPSHAVAGSVEHLSAAPINNPAPHVGLRSYETTVGLDPLLHLHQNHHSKGKPLAALVDDEPKSKEGDQEPRQGMLVLDGAELGRWMITYLENQASRPGTMTTGIDPRMTATFPGAPTGV